MIEPLTPNIEVRIPISANQKYMNMLKYLVYSLYENGGDLVKSANFIISVSRDESYRDLYQEFSWTKSFPIKFRWIDEALFKKFEYSGTALDRYRIKSNADIVIMCDADILISGDLDEIIMKSYREQKQLGFIAHVSPFNSHLEKTSKELWEEIYKKLNQESPILDKEHTGWGFMSKNKNHRYCPNYFNYGFIISPRKFIDKMNKSYEKDLETTIKVFDTCFRSQITRTVICDKYKIPTGTLSLNYNYPLHVDENEFRKINFDSKGENLPEDIKVFHYLGAGEFNKEDFKNDQTINEALNRTNISKSGMFFQKKLKSIHNKINNENISDKLYIICGGRRTGTTLMSAIMCSGDDTNLFSQEAQFLTRFLEAHKWNKENFKNFGLDFFGNYGSYQTFTKKWMNNLIKEITNFSSKGNLLVLKNPEFSHVIHEILELFPKAHIIATIRDPRDQICSEIKVTQRRIDMGKAGEHIEIRNIVKYINLYKKYLIDILDFKKEFPHKIEIYRYEDIILKPQEVLSKLNKETNLNLKFDPNLEWKNVSQNVDFKNSPSTSNLYGQAITSKSIGRFKTDLTKEEIKEIEKNFTEFMESFDYDLL